MAVRIDDSNLIWLVQEATRRGIVFTYYEESQLLEARWQDHTELMSLEGGPLQHQLYASILGNKARVKSYLQEHGFQVSKGRCFAVQERLALRDYVVSELGMPCVLKAVDEGCGDFVFPNIKSLDEFDHIYAQCIAPSPLRRVLAEAHFETTDDYRFFVCEGHPTAVIRRTPPQVIGDGVSTISTLIDKENKQRMYPKRRSVANRIWTEDPDGTRALTHQGLCHSSIPKRGQSVRLRYTSNAQYGGITEACTAAVHPSYKQTANRVAALFAGRKYLWVDMLITDPTEAATARNHVVVELSYAACFAGFLCPTVGQPVNIAVSIVDTLFPELSEPRGCP